MKLPYVNIPKLCPPEVMHSQFLGTAKTLILHLVEKFSDPQEHKNAVLMDRLRSYSFPTNILRAMPAKIDGDLKALECEILLFYDFLAFQGLIQKEQYDCLFMLSYLLSKLCGRAVVKAEIPMLEDLAKDIVETTGTSLLHLPQTVLDFGPLIVQSSYQLEDMIGKAVRTIKTGTK